MEDDRKSAFRTSGAAGRPPHDYPHTAAADPYCTAPNQLRDAMGLQPFCPWSARDRPGGPHRIPPQEGYAAPVVDAPAGPFYDGSHADVRGAVPKGYEHRANHWWLFSHLIHSSLVYDNEAASRAEYR
jgi:hypothetical protein